MKCMYCEFVIAECFSVSSNEPTIFEGRCSLRCLKQVNQDTECFVNERRVKALKRKIARLKEQLK